jgi:hypothetical protein
VTSAAISATDIPSTQSVTSGVVVVDEVVAIVGMGALDVDAASVGMGALDVDAASVEVGTDVVVDAGDVVGIGVDEDPAATAVVPSVCSSPRHPAMTRRASVSLAVATPTGPGRITRRRRTGTGRVGRSA